MIRIIYDLLWYTTMPFHSPRMFWIKLTGCKHKVNRWVTTINGTDIYECERCGKQHTRKQLQEKP